MSSTTPAGWYPDPERDGATRWWDGTQWAPSQDPAATDDRFKPRDATETTGAQAEPTWSPTQASTPQQAASTPSWQQQETPSWQQPQASTPSYGAPQDFSQTGGQQWNSFGTQPKKSRTGLLVGIGAGVLVLLLLLVGGGIFLVSNLLGAAPQQVETQGGGTTTAGDSFEVTVGQDGQSFTDIEITTAGNYQIDVISTNDEDPRIELSGNGQSWSDDDGGDETYASRLNEYLDVGTYTLMVEEFSGDPLVAQVSVQQY